MTNDGRDVNNDHQLSLRIDGSVLLVFVHDMYTYSVRVGSDECLSELKRKVCLEWPSLSPSTIDLSFEVRSLQKMVDSTVELQSLILYAIAKGIAHLNVAIFLRNSSSSTSLQSDGYSSNEKCHGVDSEVLEPYVSMHSHHVLSGVSQIFKGGAPEFRLELLKHCCLNGFRVELVKNEPSRVTAECITKDVSGCLWRVHASKKSNMGSCFVIKKMEESHICGAGVKNRQHPPMNSKLVKSVVMDMVRANPLLKAKDIITHFKMMFGVELTYYFANQGRRLALKDIHGSDALSYHQLPWFVDQILDTNPDSHCVLEKNAETNRFERFFISFVASIHGFRFCRPIVFVDATFLKGKYKGVLLAATSKNGNNGLYQIAMAVVSAENDGNWIWFMKQMKVAIGDRRNLVFISDRHHGLLTSIAQVFPSALHRYCYWHMERNLMAVIPKNHEKRGEMLELFHDMAYANTHFEFRQHLENFVEIGFARATKFVESIPFEHWANAHFRGKRYGELSSSLAESFNSWILEERHLPITALLDAIRVRIMNMYAKRREKSLDWTTKLCPEWEKELSLRMDVGRSWTVVKASETVYEVTALHKHRVDLEYWKCTCNAWKVEGFPCAHAIQCILGDRKDIYNYCERFFFSSMYRETYAKAIEPISSLSMPSSIDGVAEILPPEVLTQPGRPKTVRIGKSIKRKRDDDRPRSKGYGHHRGKKVSTSALESSTSELSGVVDSVYPDDMHASEELQSPAAPGHAVGNIVLLHSLLQLLDYYTVGKMH